MKRNGDVMRSDRLKQVMQEIDSSFDEKNLGMAKFSRFVQEAAQRGFFRSRSSRTDSSRSICLRRARTQLLPASVSTTDSAPASAESPAAPVATADEPSADRARRSRRGGRGRDREERVPRAARAETTPSSAAAEAAAPPESVPAAARVETPARPAATSAATGIGSTGLRLTRDEAFDLVKRSVAAVASWRQCSIRRNRAWCSSRTSRTRQRKSQRAQLPAYSA